MLMYALPKDEALEKIKGYFSLDREFLEELFLATAQDVVMEIPEEALEELKRNVELWLQGYAVPLEVLEEAKRIKEGNPFISELKDAFKVVIPGEDLTAEPDANYNFSKHFSELVEGNVVLDLASGFGWIPVFLSRKKRVLALDYSYNNRIIYEEDRIYIEGTTIELFPGYPEGRAFLREKKLEIYADFAELFWEAQDAKLENIVILQGDAKNLKEALSIKENKKIPLREEEIKAVTCFFGLNHIGRGWEKVVKEVYSLLKEGGKAYFALYSEHLEKFPLKGFYDWTEALEIEIIPLKNFLSEAERAGFSAEVVEHPREDLYSIVVLEK